MLNHILNELLKSSDDNIEFAKELKVAISSDLRPKAEVSLLLDKCSSLDPRFRCKCLDDLEGTKTKIADEGVTVLIWTLQQTFPLALPLQVVLLNLLFLTQKNVNLQKRSKKVWVLF